jgi:Putative zinc-finger
MTAAASHLNLDSSGHPDIETISEYVEDLLSAEATAELNEHLAVCADCRESLDALDEIRSLLGRTETPQLPDDIAIRIDAALAAEALLGAAPATDDPGAVSERLQESRTTVDHPSGRPPLPTASKGPAGPSGRRPEPPGRRRKRILRRVAMGASALAAVGLFVTATLTLRSSGTASSSSAAAGNSSAQSAAGAGSPVTAFSDSGFTSQIQALLPGSAGRSSSAGTSRTSKNPETSNNPQIAGNGERPGSSPASPGPAAVPAAVPGCALQAVSRGSEQPLTTSRGSYHGTSVYALIYPDRSDPAHAVDAYLVDTSCTAPAGASSPVLLSRTVPRP